MFAPKLTVPCRSIIIVGIRVADYSSCRINVTENKVKT